MATHGMNERIQKLRDISVNTPVHIDLERAKIETDFYRENDGKYSIPVMRAMVLKEYFSKKTLGFRNTVDHTVVTAIYSSLAFQI